MSFGGEGHSGSHPHLSGLIWLCAGGSLGLVQLGGWMPSSASGGNDQSFISFLQCQSPQPSILEVCNSSSFSSRWPQEQESRGEVGRPLRPPRLTLRLLAPSLPSWQAGGPSRGRLSTARTPQGSGSWVWQRTCPWGSWHSRRRVSVVTCAIPARLEHGSSDQSHPVTPCLLTVSLPTGTYALGG